MHVRKQRKERHPYSGHIWASAGVLESHSRFLPEAIEHKKGDKYE
jgi:hypothetical protein